MKPTLPGKRKSHKFFIKICQTWSDVFSVQMHEYRAALRHLGWIGKKHKTIGLEPRCCSDQLGVVYGKYRGVYALVCETCGKGLYSLDYLLKTLAIRCFECLTRVNYKARNMRKCTRCVFYRTVSLLPFLPIRRRWIIPPVLETPISGRDCFGWQDLSLPVFWVPLRGDKKEWRRRMWPWGFKVEIPNMVAQEINGHWWWVPQSISYKKGGKGYSTSAFICEGLEE
jgi:hypothetical protein